MRAYSVRMWVVCTCVHIVHTMQDSKLQISQHRLLFTSSMSNGRARASTSTCRRCHQKTGIDERGWHIRPRPSNRSVAIARATAPQAKPRLQTRSCNKSYLWRENPTFNPKNKIKKRVHNCNEPHSARYPAPDMEADSISQEERTLVPDYLRSRPQHRPISLS